MDQGVLGLNPAITESAIARKTSFGAGSAVVQGRPAVYMWDFGSEYRPRNTGSSAAAPDFRAAHYHQQPARFLL
jgi:hypothetical protein